MSLSEATGVVTLLFTDLVGSTDTLSRVGDDRFEVLRRAHFRLLRDAVSSHGGHEVKNIGDGLMVVFPSAADAMSAAAEMQQRIALHNRAQSDEPLAVRVGLHVGEPIRDEEDYFGTPVVVAKRLCDAAAGGEILASSLVAELAAGRAEFPFSDAAPLTLKGITEPVSAVRLLWEDVPLPDPGLPPALAGRVEAFAGREHELADLDAEWRAVRAGELRLVLLSGEPGIGKTTLGTQFARRVAENGGAVLYGRCDEDALMPYQPVVEALDEWLSVAADATLSTLPERHAVALSRILPALRERLPRLPEPRTNEPDSERYQLFEAVAGLVGTLAADRPILLMLDDLHWSDKPTLLLVRELIRRLPQANVLVLGTYRDTDLTRTHPLSELLADLRREKAVLRLALGGLPAAALERLLAGDAALGAWEKALAKELWRETEGNPLFVREILRHLVETGAIAEENGRWVPRLDLERLGIPEGVKEVIGRRLNRLSEVANRVLRVGAVAGREFDFRLLEELTDVAGDDLLDAVDEALAARILAEVPGRPDRYAFSHAVVRETLYEELSTARRLRLHRQIGLALEALYGNDNAARFSELAYHFCEAAPTGEADKAIAYARLGGDQAMAQLGYEEAARLYGMALEACDELEEPDAARCELTLSLGEARWRAGGIDAARPTFARAAELARRLGDPALLARAALGFAGAGVQFWWVEVGRVNDAVIALLEEALRCLPETDSDLRARCTSCLAQELYFQPGTMERRGRLVEDAIATARRLGDRRTLAYVLSSGHLALFSPDLDIADDPMRYGEEVLELADELGDRELAFHARAHRLTVFTMYGDLNAARVELDAAAALAEELRRPAHQFLVIGARGMMAQLEGRWEDAEHLAAEVFRSGQELGDPNALLIYAGQVTLITAVRGRFGGHTAAELVATAGDFAVEYPYIPAWRADVATLYSIVGATEEARSEFDALAKDDFASIPHDLLWLLTMFFVTETCVFLRDEARAKALYDLLRPYSKLIPLMGGPLGCTPPVAVQLASLATVLGRWDEAESHLDQADAIAADMNVAFMKNFGQLARIEMLQARGGPQDLALAAVLREDLRRAAPEDDFNTALRRGLLRDGDEDPRATPAKRRRREALRAVAARTGRRAISRLLVDISDEQIVARFGSTARLRVLLETMARTFQPSLAFGFEGRVVFELASPYTGQDGGGPSVWTVDVKGHRATVLKGAAPDAAATVRASVPDFVRLVAGELTPVGALLQRRVTAEGDVVLASRLTEMFGGVNPLEM